MSYRDLPYEYTSEGEAAELAREALDRAEQGGMKLTVTRKSPETDELHWTDPGETVALCGADNQRPANKTEKWERTRCFTCVEDKRLSEEPAPGSMTP